MVTLLALASGQADHLIFSRVALTPNDAEMVAITNPTDASIDLTNYYISDATKSSSNKYYYNLPDSADFWSGDFKDFIARFPEGLSIDSGDTLTLGIHNSAMFLSYWGYQPDITLFDDEGMLDAIEGETTIGLGEISLDQNILHDNSECLILFYWDQSSTTIQDVDYFLWGGTSYGVDKTDIEGYQSDTPIELQSYIRYHGADSSFVRKSNIETDETNSNGNGITGHDETSEDFSQSWEIVSLFVYGCTDPDAINYNVDATIDDGSCCSGTLMDDGSCCDGEISEDGTCVTPIQAIINNCIYESNEDITCADKYSLSGSTADDCPLYEETITTYGTVVDYFDITPFSGPHSFTIEDEDGYRVDFVVWPSSSAYQDGFDITLSELNVLTQPPFGTYQVKITGEVGAYCDDDLLLDIYSEWQITVEYEPDIIILGIEDKEGIFLPTDIEEAKITTEPYVIIPSLGETLDFTYSFPENSRVIIRIFNLTGQYITTLSDQFRTQSGTVTRNDESSTWNGRDHTGQIVPPGTYLFHIEAMNFSTGATSTDITPVVVGVKP